MAAFASVLAGGLMAVRLRSRLCYVLGIASGVMLGVVAFEVIPEVFRLVGEGVSTATVPMAALLAGFLGFHVVERVFLVHGSHEHHYAEHSHPEMGVASSIMLVTHSLMDGMAIGMGFQVSDAAGVAAAVAVITHDFCDGMNTASLMLASGNSVRRSFAMLVLAASAPVVGAAVSSLVAIPPRFLLAYLGAFSGSLLYVAGADLLPEAHSGSSRGRSAVLVSLTAAGMLLALLLTRIGGV